ncbi:hypothetical protein F5B20DRAFT_2140 [Whalleya microplaca]|nr:hypothetical protein F5B20DRAFT_2140 [Whalleya microplaca]
MNIDLLVLAMFMQHSHLRQACQGDVQSRCFIPRLHSMMRDDSPKNMIDPWSYCCCRHHIIQHLLVGFIIFASVGTRVFFSFHSTIFPHGRMVKVSGDDGTSERQTCFLRLGGPYALKCSVKQVNGQACFCKIHYIVFSQCDRLYVVKPAQV